MPLYEYMCSECETRFELLRPAREASDQQPCPACDHNAPRTVSKEFSAFVFREGSPRRLPDTGGYWHLGKPVSRPVNEPMQAYQHPDIHKTPPPTPLSAEELDRMELEGEAIRTRANAARDTGMPMMAPPSGSQNQVDIQRRLRVTPRKRRVPGSRSTKRRPGKDQPAT